MALRWKIPELNAELVDPQGIRAAQQYAASQSIVPVASRSPENPYLPAEGSLAEMNRNSMEGYRPNSAMTPDGTGMNGYFNAQAAVPKGYRPNVADPQGVRGQQPVDMEGYGASRQAASDRAQIQGRIAELETELTSVTNKIAEIDKATPGLAKNPKEWEIAAKRAEIGDMSAYDNLVSRGNADSASASGIENELYNAEKLTWGLHTKSNEDIAIARANIEASLRRAEEWASRTGKELPSSYYRLRKELDSVPGGNGDDDMNSRNYGNELALKIYRGTATDEDIEKGVAWAEKNSNSDAAKEIFEAAKSGKYSTVEAKERAAARKKAAKDKIIELQKLPASEQEKEFDALDQKLKDDILKQAQWDTTSNRGLVWKR